MSESGLIQPHVGIPYEHVGGAFSEYCEECKQPLRHPVHKVALAEARTAYDVFTFDGCPCFQYQEDGIRLEGHCWRVDVNCRGCGLHYEGDKAKARAAKRLLDKMDWYGKWQLVEGLRADG